MDDETKTILKSLITLTADIADTTAECLEHSAHDVERQYVAGLHERAQLFRDRAKQARQARQALERL